MRIRLFLSVNDMSDPCGIGLGTGQCVPGSGTLLAERDFSDEIAVAIDDAVGSLVDQAYRRCKQALVENRVVLDKLAVMLMKKETVDAEELQELLTTDDVKMASIA
jgi:cell division protease FtsH